MFSKCFFVIRKSYCDVINSLLFVRTELILHCDFIISNTICVVLLRVQAQLIFRYAVELSYRIIVL